MHQHALRVSIRRRSSSSSSSDVWLGACIPKPTEAACSSITAALIDAHPCVVHNTGMHHTAACTTMHSTACGRASSSTLATAQQRVRGCRSGTPTPSLPRQQSLCGSEAAAQAAPAPAPASLDLQQWGPAAAAHRQQEQQRLLPQPSLSRAPLVLTQLPLLPPLLSGAGASQKGRCPSGAPHPTQCHGGGPPRPSQQQ